METFRKPFVPNVTNLYVVGLWTEIISQVNIGHEPGADVLEAAT